MSRKLPEFIATIAQASEAPSITPAVDQIPYSEIGFFAIAGLWCLQYFLKHASNQSKESWEMLERLVESQQETSKTLAKTNSELVQRLARMHERIERIERALLNAKVS